MAAALSQAEKWRAHRAAFTLALQLGCTPREAEAQLRKRQALAAIEEKKGRLAALSAPAPSTSTPLADQPWMMRDLDK